MATVRSGSAACDVTEANNVGVRKPIAGFALADRNVRFLALAVAFETLGRSHLGHSTNVSSMASA
jgi:hypothetical protein